VELLGRGICGEFRYGRCVNGFEISTIDDVLVLLLYFVVALGVSDVWLVGCDHEDLVQNVWFTESTRYLEAIISVRSRSIYEGVMETKEMRVKKVIDQL